MTKKEINLICTNTVLDMSARVRILPNGKTVRILDGIVLSKPISADEFFQAAEQAEEKRWEEHLDGETPAPVEPILLSHSLPRPLKEFTPQMQLAIRTIDTSAATATIDVKAAFLVCIVCLDKLAGKNSSDKILTGEEIKEVGVSLGLIGDLNNTVRVLEAVGYIKGCIKNILRDKELKEQLNKIREDLNLPNEKHPDIPASSPTASPEGNLPAQIPKRVIVFKENPVVVKRKKEKTKIHALGKGLLERFKEKIRIVPTFFTGTSKTAVTEFPSQKIDPQESDFRKFLRTPDSRPYGVIARKISLGKANLPFGCLDDPYVLRKIPDKVLLAEVDGLGPKGLKKIRELTDEYLKRHPRTRK